MGEQHFTLRTRPEYRVRMAKESLKSPGAAQAPGIMYPYGKTPDWKNAVLGPYDDGDGKDTYDIGITKQLTGQLVTVKIQASNPYFNYPWGLVCDDDYIFICDASNCRIKKLRKSDLGFVSMISNGPGDGDDQFHLPYGITADDTHLYIADTYNHRIQKRLKSDFSFVAKIGSYGSGVDQMDHPNNLKIDGDYLYIADTRNSRFVKRLKSDLSYVDSCEVFWPQGITVTDIYIYTAGNYGRIFRFLKTDYSQVTQYGELNQNDLDMTNDNYNSPQDLTFDDTHFYIADSGHRRIVKRLKSNFSYVDQVGTYGDGDDQFFWPVGITVDDIYLYISDSGDNARIVKRLKSDLSFVTKIGEYGP
jgi:hypothetical protein